MSRRRRPSQQPSQSPTPHPLGPDQDMRRIIREELTKALSLPATTGGSATPVSAGYLQALQARGNNQPVAATNAMLRRDPYNNAEFGPGVPLTPAPLDPALSSGRPAPRRWEFPVSWNLQTTAMRGVPWSVLRDAADQVSIMRSCIEVRKAAITGLEWSFGIDSARARHLAKRTGDSTHAVTSDLQDKYADDIDRLQKWWQKPDRVNQWTFTDWLGALLEDSLVLDAVALYPHMAMNGDLHSLEILDSTTIKPLQDHRGATPQPPLAAYQQILWGYPRGELSQSPPELVDAEFVSAVYGRMDGDLAKTDALLYKVRNRRSRGPYGFSCVEQALTDIDLWLHRYDWLKSEYTAGVTPEMIVQVDATMTPEQMREWEAIFNDDLSGRNAERHRARFLPAGFSPSYPDATDSKFSSDFDLHLIRLICAAFDIMPTSLGFSPNHGMGGMGGSGHAQSEQDTQLYRATRPTAQWLTDIINEVCTLYLGMPPEVTFEFHGLDTDDEEKKATLLTQYVGAGLQTLNEGRDQLNMPRYEFPEASQPLMTTPTGPAWLNIEESPLGMPGNLPSAAQNQPGYQPPAPAQKPPAPRDEQVSNVPRDSKPATSATSAAKSANSVNHGRRKEQRAFMTFADNRAGTDAWRDFEFHCVDASTADAANRLAAAGDVGAVRALFEMTNDGA